MRTQTPRDPGRHALSNQLREVIGSRGLTAYGLGKEAGVDPGVIQRFLNRERDVRLETVDRLAAALGLRLVEVARRGKGRPRKAGALEPAPAGPPDGGRLPPPADADGGGEVEVTD